MQRTEEQEIEHTLMVMANPEGKSCGNCQWGGHGQGETGFITCGVHHENFTVNSLCTYWQDPNDPELLAYFEKRKEEVRKRLFVGRGIAEE
ncbi:MAG: hypothetical protein F6K19_01570 [Cyanothece sp. SIO1E1]|nr:hypothetical protein [Cyanothece sp. SIO1E1]